MMTEAREYGWTIDQLREAMVPLVAVRDGLDGCMFGTKGHDAFLALERAFDSIDSALRTLEDGDEDGPCRFCDDDSEDHEAGICVPCFDILADADAWELPLPEQRAIVAAEHTAEATR